MASGDEGVWHQHGLEMKDDALLERIQAALPVLADLSRADLLLFRKDGPDRAVAVAHARPHSLSPVYPESQVGCVVSAAERPDVLRAFHAHPWSRRVHSETVRRAPIARELLPVYGDSGRAIAVLVMDTSWLAHERQLRRSRVFRRALQRLQETALRGELVGAEDLSPFGEHDGIVVVDAELRIRYVSGIAANLYRRLGYLESLVGRHISILETRDHALASASLREQRCLEEQGTEHEFTWIRKTLPFRSRDYRPAFRRLARGNSRLSGVLITIHDATEALRREQELRIKSAMIQEIHHRVKNNLQTIASLLRLQARRAGDAAVSRILGESVNRILSVAVVHEFLSQNESATISIREVSQRILGQTVAGVLDPGKDISFRLQGGNPYLPTQQATVCALVINELVQNALEHGYDQRDKGLITVTLKDEGERVIVLVEDDGEGLPDGFNVAADGSLGLRIVQTLVEEDLKGRFALESGTAEGVGVRAVVSFPKSTVGGEGHWNARG
ncbi:MAG: histidine kinase N-terminal domain-containing protein [Anaerolineae bacterium]|nr:histidine kinase N-terminal domain-containing protein [Anaerolineae bacterium]